MRLLLVGAFPYPHAQGSQVYFQEQAIALREAGAEVELLTYASGRDEDSPLSAIAPSRALDGFRVHRSASWTSPRSLRSGPSFAKPLGGAGLAQALRHLLASSQNDAAADAHHDTLNNAPAGPRYNAILAHNAEAALVALAATSEPHPPILYCVHTLMGHELSTYAKHLPLKGFSSSSSAEKRSLGDRVIDRSGRVIDRFIARRVDGWIALTQASARVMRKNAKGPGALIPPPIPDPEVDFQTRDTADAAEVCAKHGLPLNQFFLYSGNLDSYQELDVLTAAAARLAESEATAGTAIIVASHDPAARSWAADRPGIVACVVESSQEMQTLLHAARASLVLRQALGGFPIKLANSLAAGTPALAFHGREWGLVDGENSLVCDTRDPATSIANAIANLSQNDALALKLSRGARALYLRQHRPEVAAAETLALLERVGSFRKQIGSLPGV